MIIIKLIEFLRKRLKLVIRLSYVVLALLVVNDTFFVDKSDAHTWMEHIPGFWSLFGFFSCAIIIIGSKWYGHRGIMTREDYYDK